MKVLNILNKNLLFQFDVVCTVHHIQLCKQNQQDALFFTYIYSIISISTLHVSNDRIVRNMQSDRSQRGNQSSWTRLHDFVQSYEYSKQRKLLMMNDTIGRNMQSGYKDYRININKKDLILLVCLHNCQSARKYGITVYGVRGLRPLTPRFGLTQTLPKSFSVLQFTQHFCNCYSLLIFSTTLLSLLSAQFPRMALPLILILCKNFSKFLSSVIQVYPAIFLNAS